MFRTRYLMGVCTDRERLVSMTNSALGCPFGRNFDFYFLSMMHDEVKVFAFPSKFLIAPKLLFLAVCLLNLYLYINF